MGETFTNCNVLQKEVIAIKIDTLLIPETKLDNTFHQFIVDGFRFYRTELGRGLMLFDRKDIPTRLLPNPSGNREYLCQKLV